MYIDDIYKESYPLLTKNREFILSELKKEIERIESTLENGLKEFLPVYMIPKKIKYIETMPMNNHGKADRKYLGGLAE